jgi:hypothetical protein
VGSPERGHALKGPSVRVICGTGERKFRRISILGTSPTLKPEGINGCSGLFSAVGTSVSWHIVQPEGTFSQRIAGDSRDFYGDQPRLGRELLGFIHFYSATSQDGGACLARGLAVVLSCHDNTAPYFNPSTT